MNLHITGVLPAKPGLRKIDAKAVLATKLLLDTLKDHPKVKIVDVADVSGQKISCTGENGQLKAAIVSLPTFLDWAKPINVAEATNMGNKPHRAKAVMEHIQLILTLLTHGVELTMLEPSVNSLEGVYTRDIAAVIGNKCVLANMVAQPRWPEEKTIVGGIKPPIEVKIEGGNVIVDGDTVFLGIGDRTNLVAAIWLQELLGTVFQVVPIHLIPGVLHLDCAFSPIAKPNGTSGGALVYKPAFVNENDLKLFAKIYGRTFELGEDEYKLLGANTFALDPETRIVTPSAGTIIDILKHELHQKVIPVALHEIVKGEGYVRCSIMPLVRE